MHKRSNRQLIALICCACFIAVSVLSMVFVLAHANHLCAGGGCRVCIEIHNTQNLLKRLCMAIMAGLCIGVVRSFQRQLVHTAVPVVSLPTLISLNIRLNN